MTDVHVNRSAPRRRLVAFWCIAFIGLSACSASDGADPPASDSSTLTSLDEAALTISLSGAAEATLGEPVEVMVRLTNHAQRSISASYELSLVSPQGESTPFHTATVFVPFGESVTEAAAVTTSRWHTDTGEFGIVAELVEPALASEPVEQTVAVGPTDRIMPAFDDVTAHAGVATTVPNPDCGQFSNGAAWGDVDDDGWPDLLVTRLDDPVQLFVNGGDGTFSDQTESLGVAATGVNGAAFADYDNDGDADLALAGDGPDRLLQNDGSGRYVDVTATAGIAGDDIARGMSASWGDFDNDGFVDLYVTNYMECTGPWSTAEEIISNVEYHPDVLYRNDGDGTFTDTTRDLPGSDAIGAGFAAAWLDIDNDGLTDLYVGNDFVGLSPDHNRLWRNGGDRAGGWNFTDVSLDSGAGLYMNTMGIGVSDVDRDGDLDMALSNIGGNKLLRSNGDGSFVEEARSGIERPYQGVDYYTITWGSAFYDLDLDGWEDLVMTAGNLPQAPDVTTGEQPNMVFMNDGSGLRFLDVSAFSGLDDDGESKGAAFADFDRDGRMDVFVVNQDGQPRLYRNVTPRGDRHWLVVDPIGTVSNRDSCGALVTAFVGGAAMTRQVLCGSGGSGSAHQNAVHFGLGESASVEHVEVRWPSGRSLVIDEVPVDATIVVEEPPA